MKLEAAKRKLHEGYQQAEDGLSLPPQILDIFLFGYSVIDWRFARLGWYAPKQIVIEI